MTVPLVVDTDIGSDVDDALALALAVRHPDLELRAVSTVSSEPEVRARMARRLLDVAGADAVEVAAGQSARGDERNEIGAEHRELLDASSGWEPRADALDLYGRLRRGTAVATIGQLTNLAIALEQHATLARIVPELTVMGGSFEPFIASDGRTYGAERDWNLVLDPPAATRALAAGWDLRYVPIDVTFGAPLLRSHVERLRAGDELCVLLADLVDGWRARALPPEAPDDVACYLHDPLAVACVTECEFIEAVHLSVSVVIDASGVPRTVIDPTEGRPATVVRTVDAPAFADWLVDTLLLS